MTNLERLRDLRDDLAALADRFTRYAEASDRYAHELTDKTKAAAKAVDEGIGEVLLDLDTEMEWDDE